MTCVAWVALRPGASWYLYMGSKTALCSSTWALCTSTGALQTDLWSQETSKMLPRPILERFQSSPRGSGSPKTLKYNVFAIFHVAPQTSSRTSKSAPGRSQNHPQERPGAARDSPKSSPRGFKTAPRAAKSAPRAPRAAQTRLPNGPGGEVGPN